MVGIKVFNMPITLDCNLHCKYCFRDSFERIKVPELSSEMVGFLRSLEGKGCVTITGGEPLIYFDKVKKIFSYVSKGIKKEIITNGTLLTPEIVDYLNENDVHVVLSYDGPETKFLRGVDVLETRHMRGVIRNIRSLKVSSVATTYNTDVWLNFFDVAKKLGRLDFEYFSGPLMDDKFNHYLVDGFDYETYVSTLIQFTRSKFRISRMGKRIKRTYGFSILPNGVVCGNTKIGARYGTIFDTLESCEKSAIESGDLNYCMNTNCRHNGYCRFIPQSASEHSCKCRSMIMEREQNEDYIRSVDKYLEMHLEDIIAKYGWDPKFVTSGYWEGS